MRAGPPGDTLGFVHEAALYSSEAELMDLVGPFLREGVEAGEPTFAALAPGTEAVVRAGLGPRSKVAFLPGDERYARPATAIASYRKLFADLVAEGAEQIRVVGEVPHPGTGGRWHEWVRYEAVINEAYDAFPIWGMCAYDTRITPGPVLADVLASHPHVAAPGGRHVANPGGHAHRELLAGRALPPPAIPAHAPDVTLVDPRPGVARGAASDMAAQAGLGEGAVDDLVLVVSELVTNGHRHGQPPVQLDLWAEPGRVVAEVADHGAGPLDPFSGLLPPDAAPGGLGLWLAHQLCDELAVGHHDGRFVVRASVGQSR